mmetsp:Transcript_28575/g.55969  ORF Transcript_28575/g.55969 Transcript_28575/m.55969 type:complete len:103 (+) Transcript_28575:1056-1364(+)
MGIVWALSRASFCQLRAHLCGEFRGADEDGDVYGRLDRGYLDRGMGGRVAAEEKTQNLTNLIYSMTQLRESETILRYPFSFSVCPCACPHLCPRLLIWKERN